MKHAASRRPEDELDAWVREELEALAGNLRSNRRASDDQHGRHLHAVAEAEELDRSDGELSPETPSDPLMSLLDETDVSFVERSAEWLRGRPNADMILEEIWRLVVAEQSGEYDDDSAEEGPQHVAPHAESDNPANDPQPDPDPDIA